MENNNIIGILGVNLAGGRYGYIFHLMCDEDYSKEYREGVLRGFLLTAAMDSHRTQRLRWLSTARVGKNPRGISQQYFFILSIVPDPIRSLNYLTKYENNSNGCLWGEIIFILKCNLKNCRSGLY